MSHCKGCCEDANGVTLCSCTHPESAHEDGQCSGGSCEYACGTFWPRAADGPDGLCSPCRELAVRGKTVVDRALATAPSNDRAGSNG